MSWLLASEQASLVGVLSLAVTTFGFALAAWGLRKTYQQASAAETAAEVASSAVTELQIRIDSYSALRDVNEAMMSIESCKKHLRNEAWRDASDLYEDAHRALIRLTNSDLDLGWQLASDLVKLAAHTKAFCDQVDAALVGKESYPDLAKVYQAIRENYRILSAINAALEKRVVT